MKLSTHTSPLRAAWIALLLAAGMAALAGCDEGELEEAGDEISDAADDAADEAEDEL